jgi:benzoyl-CoA reductase/2-hydroxyglutaryl-CoA dehydratase subunit BcrC/BadD/HgdB
VDISDEKLTAAIVEQNRLRMLIKKLYHLNLSHNHALSGKEMNRIVKAGSQLPGNEMIRQLTNLQEEISAAGSLERGNSPRVMITGSVLENPQIVELLEQCGARVVIDDLCSGTRQFWQTVEVDENPLESLSRHYISRVTCPRMKDTARRFDQIHRLIEDFKVEGVIFYTMKFCDPFLYDVPRLKEYLLTRKIPALILEADYTPGTLGRVRTRVEAFIEMLRQDIGAI